MKQRLTILLLSAAWLLASPLFSQKTTSPKAPFAPDTSVQRLFEKHQKLRWIKYFSGRLDDVSDVDIALGYDGQNCRGYLTYTESRTRLKLDGSFRGNEILLREIGPGDETTGYIRGTFSEKQFNADWTNYNNTIGSRLEAEEINVSQIGGSHCGDNKWVNRYFTVWNNGRFEIILSRANNGQLCGYAWTEYDQKTYFLKGKMLENGDFSLDLKKADGSPGGKFKGNMRFLQNLEVSWLDSGGGNRFFNLSLKESAQVGCYEFADFASSYDVTFPKLKCNGCNTWFERQVGAWLQKCKANFAQQAQPESIPSSRASLRASGWAEIALWNDDILSGTLTFSESWSDAQHGVSFNFDLKSGKEIPLNDLFLKNFNAKTWLAEHAEKEKTKLPRWEEADFKAWVEKNGFPLWFIRREGLVLSAPFDPVFGQPTILIPFSVMKPYLKKDSVVSKFVK